MKQMIVLISTIVLGIAIAVMVMGFKKQAQSLSTSVNDGITALEKEFTSESAIK